MPLLPGCTFNNPINNGQIPAVPDPRQAPNLAPNQGDHVFGDVIGTVQTSLQNIFGGGAEWVNRFQGFSQPAFEQWQAFNRFDLGHTGNNQPIMQRNGAPEPDEHAYVFGIYSQRFQWSFCEIVCAGFVAGLESRQIGGGSSAWRTSVMSRFDDVLKRLVDQTALTAYLQAPQNIRQADPINVRHPVISLQEARDLANLTNQSNSQSKNRILQIYGNFHSARANLEGMLMRFDGPTRTIV